MHPHNRPFDPNNPYAYQENNPSPPPTRPMARPFFIHSSMPDMAGYASYIGNRVFTNFPHTDDSIPTPFTQSPIDLSPTTIDLSQNETVPETQPPNDGPSAPQPIKKRSHKKKTEADKALETIKRKQLKWIVPEELALARGWFQQSQHSTLGNSQHRTHLWQGVSKIFHEELGKEVYRENDSLSSKWTEISTQLTKYSGFLNKAKQNPKSGETEADIVTNALLQFKTNVGTDFRFMHCWEICKFHPKWANIPSGSESNTSSKRSRASSQSDARDQEIEDLFDDLPSPNRPEYGRDATKRRAQKSRCATASPSAGSSLLHRGIYSDQLDAISSKMDTFNVFQQQRIEIRKSKEARDAAREAERQRREDLKILSQPIDHLKGDELEIVLQMREEIKNKYKH
ncbi:putative glutathione transferase [Helianthus annuus]|nr:putative glutathione transferase [Helianthus annuus]KAJ0889775.1 putative glutathione transferase [Helianthus annuus]